MVQSVMKAVDFYVCRMPIKFPIVIGKQMYMFLCASYFYICIYTYIYIIYVYHIQKIYCPNVTHLIFIYIYDTEINPHL